MHTGEFFRNPIKQGSHSSNTYYVFKQITGESGSGKTEAAKLTLQYLAAVTSHERHFHAVKYQILQSNPVLEGKELKWHMG